MLKSYVFDKMVEESADSIFLAGPTHRIKDDKELKRLPRSSQPKKEKSEEEPVHRWREDALEFLEEKGFNGVVYIPEWEFNSKPEDWTYSRQVDWEKGAMTAAKVILFWIPRELHVLPGFTTNVEFGEWLNSGKIVAGAPLDTLKIRYIKERCKRSEIPWAESLQGCIHNALTILKQLTGPIGNTFFTSDTHFGEERTMELSKRPFSSVEEMDWEMVKQWNSVVTDKDTVYHLGDFGNPRMIKHLRGRDICLLPGNYDSEIITSRLQEDNRVSLIGSNHQLMFDNIRFSLIHAPEEGQGKFEGENFFLFGHIHKLQMVKKNGLNVGVDCHQYKPLDAKTVLFYHNAIVNHYDHNVFMEKCSFLEAVD